MVSDPAIGRVVGAYRLIAPLGEGGMATVYRAEHTAIGKEVAIKILKPGLAKQPEMVLRFFHEARSVNQVRHENLIDILDYGETPNKEHYIVMELLDGEPLSHVIKTQAPLPLRRLGHIGLQICSALDAVHQKGIIHRDLKGSNIFLTTRAGQKDFVKILDFGIAKLPKTQELPEELKTVTGAMMGTPMFMSPEQGKGLEVDQQTDIYALGVLLYQLATGVPPFYNENAVLLALMHITEKVPPPREKNPDIPAALEAVILRCLEKERGARYQTMSQVAEDLRSAVSLDLEPYFLSGQPATAPDTYQGTIPPAEVEKTSLSPRTRGAVLGLTSALLASGLVFVLFYPPTNSNGRAPLSTPHPVTQEEPPTTSTLLPTQTEATTITLTSQPASEQPSTLAASLPTEESLAKEKVDTSGSSKKKGARKITSTKPDKKMAPTEKKSIIGKDFTTTFDDAF